MLKFKKKKAAAEFGTTLNEKDFFFNMEEGRNSATKCRKCIISVVLRTFCMSELLWELNKYKYLGSFSEIAPFDLGMGSLGIS